MRRLFILFAAVCLLTACDKDKDADYIAQYFFGKDSKTQVTPTPDVPDNGNAVLAKAKEVINKVGDLYKECNSIKELEKYSEEIAKIENVEDVYFTNISMFVKIKDFMTVSYSFFPKPKFHQPTDMEPLMTREVGTRVETNGSISHLGLENAVIVDQTFEDYDWKEVKSKLKKILDDEKIETKIRNAPSLKFFENQMFDYDIVFFICHGCYDPVSKLHWLILCTYELFDWSQYQKLSDWEKINNNLFEGDYYKYKGYIEGQQLAINYQKMSINGKMTDVASFAISENFISAQQKEFKKKGKAIVFNVACQSLMGGEESIEDRNEIDFSFARAFEGRGAGVYFGYDESNGAGLQGGLRLLQGIVSGQSVYGAFKLLPEWVRHENKDDGDDDNGIPATRHWTADLYYYPAVSEMINSSQISPTLYEKDETDADFIITATEPYYLIDFELSDPWIFNWHNYYNTEVAYGFEISTTKDFERSRTKDLGEEHINEKDCRLKNNVVTFSHKVSKSELDPGTTYYYRAYLNDCSNKIYSDYREFTTQDRIEQVVPDDIRDKMDPFIPIYEGNNPPAVEGVFLIDPAEIVYDTTNNYNAGDQGFTPIYLKFSNQSITQNTIDYEEKDVNSAGKIVSESSGPGAFISGEGDNFSVFFSTSGVSHRDTYDISYKTSLVISGTKTSSGIKDIRYAFVMVDKKNDKEHDIMDVGEFRVFKDGDGLATTASWPSGARSWGWGYGVRNGNITTPWSIFSKKK